MRYLRLSLAILMFALFPCLCACTQKAQEAPSGTAPTSESEFEAPSEKFDPNNV